MNAKTIVQRGRHSHLVLLACLGWLPVAATRAQVTNCASAPPGLVGWWRAEGNANDSVNGNDGMVQPGGRFGAGMVGQAFAFNGATNSFIEVPDAPSLHATAAVTIEFWVKRTSLDFSSHTADYVLEKGGDWTGDQVNYGAALHTGAYNYCLHFTFAGGWRGGGTVPDMNWHHCAIVARNGDANPTFYINGVAQPVMFGQGASTITLFDSNRPLHIGAMIDPITGWMYYGRELVDELSIYNRALSAAEIQAIYNAGSAGKCPLNNWTNSFSAKWESTSWSLGTLPAPNQVVNIMNDGYKAVNIDSGTVSRFPSSLTVGSLEVGAPTNALSTLLLNYAGLDTPLRVLNSCVIGTNGTLLNLSSSFEVDGTAGGVLTIDGGTFTQEGGLTVVTPSVQVLNGSLNATNATMNLGPLQVGSGYPQYGTFYQSGGTILSSAVSIGRGTYSLMTNGTLYALSSTYLNNPEASFIQTGGSNYGDVHIDQGYYQLEGGLVQGTNLSTITLGGFTQNGGTVEVQNLSARGLGSDFSIWPSYVLNAGVLHCATLNITHYGIFLESGIGTLVLTNRLNLFDPSGPGARFELDGGNAFMPSLVISNGGDYLQRAGTNEVSGGISLYNTALAIYGGRLSSANTGVGEGARVWQQGGMHEISEVLSINGAYALEKGSLSVNGIYMRGTLLIDNLEGIPPVLNNSGLINFGGTLAVSVSQSSMGQLGLSANGTISLGNQPLVLRFVDSSPLNWDSNSRLTIEGWSGSYFGNGSNQIYIGNTSGGLTPSQLSQVRFLNPVGSPPGYYDARLLSNGEVVPVSAAALQSSRSGERLVLTWTGNYQLLSATNVLGPYQPVSGVASPYTNNLAAEHQRFFMLQGQ